MQTSETETINRFKFYVKTIRTGKIYESVTYTKFRDFTQG